MKLATQSIGSRGFHQGQGVKWEGANWNEKPQLTRNVRRFAVLLHQMHEHVEQPPQLQQQQQQQHDN